MGRARKLLRSKALRLLAVLVVIVYLMNTSLLAPKPDGPPQLLAHRGLAQTFPMEGIGNDTCTAERIYPPEHPYLENTLASMEAAFEAGAGMVEFDVHWTKDDQFAVFHDWTLDCRTDLKGVTRDYTMAELKKADIGYGYTADEGRTYPFRGKGIGLMPTLTEVLDRFPDRYLLLHIKSNDPREGERLASILAELPAGRREKLTVYGGDQPVAELKKKLPSLRVMSKETLKGCLLSYLAVGWTGYMPEACRHTQLQLPEKLAPLLWGWPYQFLNRMERADTRVIVVGGDGSEFSSGFDTPEDLKRLPDGFTGWIWTNRIDRVAKAVLPDTP
ncbi:glycerophosphodiester phosphodiesterase family protein [Paenibacillus aurantius]|uniref:Glycerophosphodiester phosphodiesterase family protein n=1 Tax=Paenibacillus aurantius TaxID=2918900 RepID=A0AA96RDT3_9BACL|nr:glycerophosphodiester phosphodiesterase family protein [Paenibacillus aurantius]WNQ09448.1 glycerophosphodiester phosphodiesterase family protein [Paenibacillus aurantius]